MHNAHELAFTNHKVELALQAIADALALAPQIIIEICPNEPRASACLMNGEEISTDKAIAEAMADCCKSGDCQDACEYVRDRIGVVFRIVARNAAGEYENRLATDDEKQATCKAIYFESETDFSRDGWADTYLIWQAASEFENND